MSYQGSHDRNCLEVYLFGYSTWGRVVYEANARIIGEHGVFSVVHIKDEGYIVAWRPGRNVTRHWNIRLMTNDVDGYPYGRTEIYETRQEACDSIPEWMYRFKYPKKEKHWRMPRDSQRSKVYRWEHKMAHDIGQKEEVLSKTYGGTGYISTDVYVERDSLSLRRSREFLQKTLNEICSGLDEEVPTLKFRSGGQRSYGGFNIRLAPSHNNTLILVHELAHVIHRRWGDWTTESAHGAEYVGIYAYMLVRFCGVDYNQLILHARDAGVKISMPKQFWNWYNTIEQKEAA